MSSKLIYRSSGSSIRTLINRHIRPTVAATNIQTEPPENIYNCHYLLPNSFVPPPVNIGYNFGREVTGFSVLGDVVRGERKFEAAKSNYDDESIDDELDDEDDGEIEYAVTDDEDDDYEFDDDGDDHLGSDDDD